MWKKGVSLSNPVASILNCKVKLHKWGRPIKQKLKIKITLKNRTEIIQVENMEINDNINLINEHLSGKV